MEMKILQEWSNNVMKMCFTWALSSSSILSVGAVQKNAEFPEFDLLYGYAITPHITPTRN